jgi:predicted transposase YbfD/YdcC
VSCICIITIDAAGTRTAIAEKIVAGGGDYPQGAFGSVLALKGNQKCLAEDVVRLVEWAHSIKFAEMQHDADARYALEIA